MRRRTLHRIYISSRSVVGAQSLSKILPLIWPPTPDFPMLFTALPMILHYTCGGCYKIVRMIPMSRRTKAAKMMAKVGIDGTKSRFMRCRWKNQTQDERGKPGVLQSMAKQTKPRTWPLGV